MKQALVAIYLIMVDGQYRAIPHAPEPRRNRPCPRGSNTAWVLGGIPESAALLPGYGDTAWRCDVMTWGIGVLGYGVD